MTFALLAGYALGVLLETPVLLAGLSSCHTLKNKFKAGLLLTACTYPFVVLLMPRLINPETNYTLFIAVTETLVPIVECAVFWFVFHRNLLFKQDENFHLSRNILARDFVVIVVANLVSFSSGEILARLASNL